MGNKISYKEFEEICTSDVLDNIIYQFRYLVNFFYKYPNQTEVITVDCNNLSVNSDLINSFKGFQLSFDSRFRERNNYIVFVDPSKDIIEEYNTFINKYLPSNVRPTHICVLSEDISVIEETYSMLENSNSNLTLVNVTQKFNPSVAVNSRIIAGYGEDKVFAISEYCNKLYTYQKYPSTDFIREFNLAVEDIMSKAKGKMIIYGGDYMTGSKSMYNMLVSEIYLRNRSYKFHVEKEDSEAVAIKISSHLYRPYMMLVEDVVRFVNQFPSVTAEYKESFMLYNVIRNCTLYTKVSYVPYNSLDKSQVQYSIFNTKKLNIIPLATYYNLEDPNLEKASSNELKLRELIYQLYDVFPVEKSKIIDITSLFFFELDGIEYVGYNHEYSIKCDFKSYLVGLPAVKRTISFEELSQLLFVSPFIDLTDVLRVLTGARLIEGSDFKSLMPVPTLRKNCVALSSHHISNKSEDFSGIPNALFCIGMYSKECYTTRVGLYRNIADKIGIDKTRKMLDSFGAFNIITNRYLELTLDKN